MGEGEAWGRLLEGWLRDDPEARRVLRLAVGRCGEGRIAPVQLEDQVRAATRDLLAALGRGDRGAALGRL